MQTSAFAEAFWAISTIFPICAIFFSRRTPYH